MPGKSHCVVLHFAIDKQDVTPIWSWPSLSEVKGFPVGGLGKICTRTLK